MKTNKDTLNFNGIEIKGIDAIDIMTMSEKNKNSYSFRNGFDNLVIDFQKELKERYNFEIESITIKKGIL